MSYNSSDIGLILILNGATVQINRYISIILLLFGTVGNLLNCLALSQQKLRSNPCAFLFLSSSIANLITLISGLVVRLLGAWSANISDTIDSLCKLRFFILYTSRVTASWLIAFATIDRWFSSSTDIHRRQKSTLKNSKRGMIYIICLSSLVHAQIFYCYEANMVDTPSKCYGKTTWCRILNDAEFICINVIIPSLLMFIFGLMTIFNVRQATLRRVQPVVIKPIRQTIDTNRLSQQSRKSDHDLLVMLFAQVILLTLFSLPQAIQNLYSNIFLNQINSPLTNAINNLIFNFCFLSTYVTNGMPFYIYTLSGGTIFRQSLLNAIRQFIRKVTCPRR